MAKANWAVVNPSQGSGNATVNVSSSAEHTGRTARNTVLTISAPNVTPVTVDVLQRGKPAYVYAQDNASAAQGGQNVTISGKSNSKKLTWSLGAGELDVVLPATYTAASLVVNNGAEISGDPGASQEYDFSIVLTVPANASVLEISRQIIVEDESGNVDTCVLTQAAGAPTLSVSKTSIELEYTGEAVSFDITSNTSWAIN